MRNATAVQPPKGMPESLLLNFDGYAYEKEKDQERLTRQSEHVLAYMLRNGWQALHEIVAGLERQHAGQVVTCDLCQDAGVRFPEASVSAQLRNLRKARFGGWTVDKRRRGESGTWEYRVSKQCGVN
jgi:hypothetical protein